MTITEAFLVTDFGSRQEFAPSESSIGSAHKYSRCYDVKPDIRQYTPDENTQTAMTSRHYNTSPEDNSRRSSTEENRTQHRGRISLVL